MEDMFKPIPIHVPIRFGSDQVIYGNELNKVLELLTINIQNAVIAQIKQRIPMDKLVLDGDEPEIEWKYKGGLKNKMGYSPEQIIDSSNNVDAVFRLWGSNIKSADDKQGNLLAFKEGDADLKISSLASTTTPAKDLQEEA